MLFFSSKRRIIDETSHEKILMKNVCKLHYVEKSSTNKNFITLAFSLYRPIKSYRRSQWKIFLLFSFRLITHYPCISLSPSAENIIKILSGRFSSIMLIYNKLLLIMQKINKNLWIFKLQKNLASLFPISKKIFERNN